MLVTLDCITEWLKPEPEVWGGSTTLKQFYKSRLKGKIMNLIIHLKAGKKIKAEH